MDDLLLFDYIEGNLSGIEKLDMEKAISGDPLLKAEIELLMDCKLSAPQHITFPVDKIIQKHWLWDSLNSKFALLGSISAIVVVAVMLLLFQNESENRPSEKAGAISNHADITIDEEAIPKETVQETEIEIIIDEEAIPKETVQETEIEIIIDEEAIPKETVQETEIEIIIDEEAIPKEAVQEIEIIQPEQENPTLITHDENGKRSVQHPTNAPQSILEDLPKELPANMVESINVSDSQAIKIVNEPADVVEPVNVSTEGEPKIPEENKEAIQQAVDLNNTIPVDGKKVRKKKSKLKKLKWGEAVMPTDDF